MRKKEFRRCIRERSLLVALVLLRSWWSTEGGGVAVLEGVTWGIGCLVAKRTMGGQTGGPGMPPRGSWDLVVVLVVDNRANFTDSAGHAKIGQFTDTHLVDQHVLQLDVSVDIAHYIMKVLETSHDLPEHHADIVMRKSRGTVALEDIEQGASRTELSDKVIGIGSVIGLEKGKNMFVMKWRPNLSFVIKALCFHIGVWLTGYVRATYDLYGDDISRRGSSGADCGKTTATDDGTEHIPSYCLTLIIWESNWGVDVWAEGGEKEGGRGAWYLAHGERRG
jgi:hypothetical protein